MIKLIKGIAPYQLTDQFIMEGTERYKKTKESVWNVGWLKQALLDLSHNKCAYCEGRLDEKSDFMEVEHFKDKFEYPDDVLKWDNLLPSCKHCNGHKSTHDVLEEPIINPFIDTPREHLYLKSYLYKSKDDLGRSTIDVLDLNESDRLVMARCELGTEINKILEERLDEIKAGLSRKGAEKRFQNKMRKLLLMCQPDSEYSAMCSTEVIKSIEYAEIVKHMKKLDLWNEEFEKYHTTMFSIALV